MHAPSQFTGTAHISKLKFTGLSNHCQSYTILFPTLHCKYIQPWCLPCIHFIHSLPYFLSRYCSFIYFSLYRNLISYIVNYMCCLFASISSTRSTRSKYSTLRTALQSIFFPVIFPNGSLLGQSASLCSVFSYDSIFHFCILECS